MTCEYLSTYTLLMYTFHSARLVPESDSETVDPMGSLLVGDATKSAPILVSIIICII